MSSRSDNFAEWTDSKCRCSPCFNNIVLLESCSYVSLRVTKFSCTRARFNVDVCVWLCCHPRKTQEKNPKIILVMQSYFCFLFLSLSLDSFRLPKWFYSILLVCRSVFAGIFLLDRKCLSCSCVHIFFRAHITSIT